ncbi:MAG: hypothetical protein K6G17_01000 [Oscillospiraceae bacterium]|nr:hypothetical protein [Oscillospiraceae bacterium]
MAGGEIKGRIPVKRELSEAMKQIESVLRGTRETAQTESGEGSQETGRAGRLAGVDPEPLRQLLRERDEAAREQTERRVDEATEEAVRQLRQSEEDAQAGFQSQRDRIAADELRALDNQAYYAEARGDRGGIGLAQYGSIQNTAAVNRAAVNREQQRLAADTARQIAELRAQGEYRKADALLDLTQKQLTQLLQLEQWAREQNMSAERFNLELARWEAEYAWSAHQFGVKTELELAALRGELLDGTPTYAARQAERAQLAAAAQALLEAGLTLTPEQIAALGWTEGQYEELIRRRGSGSGSTGSTGSTGGIGVPFQLFAGWMTALRDAEDPEKVMEQIRGSSYYDQLSDEQAKAIGRAYRARG